MTNDELIDKLKEFSPKFLETSYEDEGVYLVFGGFGSFFSDLINLYGSGKVEPRSYFYSNVENSYNDNEVLIKEIKNIFEFIDELFSIQDDGVRDILNTCIFEAIMGSDYSYNLARKYLSKKAYNHYLEITKR
ncbi:hypothetical protein Xmau_04449 [Xenorhabdus mauleonii]|uniref:Uncharacterized protein n=1 Tax=Xenorhabdus mauleonii TaxID=351675 RepID=A0A1I3YG55_9GAMM|nr:hypothetical protein [Xenorhabdus mauleonii]PHM35790.1 hypothetical protein Xmau_04449 [Xenorhabdus mauleonii]SFK30261.1 hypothetical protein SAMN05421680_1519 [Xenorhabdus mauleonii]